MNSENIQQKFFFESLQKLIPSLNAQQKEAISSIDGPVQIIAGPGSGKTLVLVLRTLYLLILKKAKPNEIILTTFTEKAAFEIRDRISQLARSLNLQEPLHELKIGTIHGLCNKFINQYRHYTNLKNNFDVLDDLTQIFFIYEHFQEIIGEKSEDRFLTKWKTKWSTIRAIIPYFNKITEELIDIESSKSDLIFVKKLFESYKKYEHILFETNRLDFAHQQKIFFELLNNPQINEKIQKSIQYIMVDEYQDTNYIQEQIILNLGIQYNNICVVGDEDQALYRFRGATVRNILEFQSHFSKIKQISLLINYRSHKKIIDTYNKFINSIDWINYDGPLNFRFDKTISENKDTIFPNYPAVFSIWGINENDEASRFASMVKFLKDHKIIQDYNQIALLLRSIRLESSEKYILALEKLNIPYFAPRAKGFFKNEEIKLLIGCLAIIFGFFGDNIKDLKTSMQSFIEYIQESIIQVGPYIQKSPQLTEFIRECVMEIEKLRVGETLDKSITDYFYHILAFKPFSETHRLQRLNRIRNNRVTDLFHKISRALINYCVAYQLGTIVIGYNAGWKQRCNMGKTNNQNFVEIPFRKLVQQLRYKAALLGIRVMLVEETHTSKCSFVDHEPIEHHDLYLGRRGVYNPETGKVMRGLFKTKAGPIINSDINGAYNILRKAFPEVVSADRIEGLGLVPYSLRLKELNQLTELNQLNNLNSSVEALPEAGPADGIEVSGSHPVSKANATQQSLLNYVRER